MKTILADVMNEVDRASSIWPGWPDDPLHAVAVVGEEFGELMKAVLQMTYEPNKTSIDEMRIEAIQTAATLIRFIDHIDRYEFKRSNQS